MPSRREHPSCDITDRSLFFSHSRDTDAYKASSLVRTEWNCSKHGLRNTIFKETTCHASLRLSRTLKFFLLCCDRRTQCVRIHFRRSKASTSVSTATAHSLLRETLGACSDFWTTSAATLRLRPWSTGVTVTPDHRLPFTKLHPGGV